MTLKRYEPRTSMRSIEDEMGRVMRDWWQGLDQGAELVGSWCPAVDVKEEVDQYLIAVDLPGVAPKDIDISVEQNVLTIKGDRRDEREVDKEGYHRMERLHGQFYRRLGLSNSADAEHVKAVDHNGVLEITVPKLPEAKAHKIKVVTH